MSKRAVVAMPHNEAAEEHVVGALQIDPEAMAIVSGVLAPEDFYIQRYGMMYGAMLALRLRNEPLDFALLCAELDRRGQLEQVGGASALIKSANSVPSAVNVKEYAGLVADLSERRRLIRAAEQAARLAFDESLDQDEVRSGARTAVEGAISARSRAKVLQAKRAASVLYERAGRYAQEPIKAPAVRGLSTGLLDLDDLLFGLDEGLYLIGAVQHVGKTVLLQNISCNVAAQGFPVLFFSMEHSPEHMFDRIISARTGIHIMDIMRGLDGERLSQYARACDEVSSWPMEIIGGRLGTVQVRAEVESRPGVKLVVVDNIEIACSDVPGREPYKILQDGAYRLLDVAQDAGVPVMVTMQVATKASERRADQRPMMSDLYGSDGPEQAASVTLLLHRQKRFKPSEFGPGDPDILEVHCWKDKVFYSGTGRGVELLLGPQGQVRNKEWRRQEFDGY